MRPVELFERHLRSCGCNHVDDDRGPGNSGHSRPGQGHLRGRPVLAEVVAKQLLDVRYDDLWFGNHIPFSPRPECSLADPQIQELTCDSRCWRNPHQPRVPLLQDAYRADPRRLRSQDVTERIYLAGVVNNTPDISRAESATPSNSARRPPIAGISDVGFLYWHRQ